MKWLWFSSGAICGLSVLSLSFASVPTPGRVTDDTVIYENLSEIRAAKTQDLNFDRDLDHLSDLESQYRGKPRVMRTRSYRNHSKSQIRPSAPRASARGGSAAYRAKRLEAPMSRISAQSYHYGSR